MSVRNVTPLLPMRQQGIGRRSRWVADLTLDADECEAVAYALGLHDGGALQLLATAEALRELAAENDPTADQGPRQDAGGSL